MVRATSSLPVPLSPRISTVMSVSATCSMMSRTSRIFGLSPREQQQLGLAARASPQQLDLLLEGALLQRLLEGELELFHLEGLAQEVGGPEPHGLDDVPGLAVAREHHHRHLGQALLELAQRLEPVHARQHHVEGDRRPGASRRASASASSASAAAKTV